MKKSLLIIASFSISILLLFTQCQKLQEDCKNAICTEEFRSISITLKHKDETPLLLDSSKVFRKSINSFLESNHRWDHAHKYGAYVVVDDMMQKELENREEIFTFTGYLDGKIIHQQDLLIGADCCHVQYLGSEPLIHIIELE